MLRVVSHPLGPLPTVAPRTRCMARRPRRGTGPERRARRRAPAGCTSRVRWSSPPGSSPDSSPGRSTPCTRRLRPRHWHACSSDAGGDRSCRCSGSPATITTSPKRARPPGWTRPERWWIGACLLVPPSAPQLPMSAEQLLPAEHRRRDCSCSSRVSPAGPPRDATLDWLRRHYVAGATMHGAYRRRDRRTARAVRRPLFRSDSPGRQAGAGAAARRRTAARRGTRRGPRGTSRCRHRHRRRRRRHAGVRDHGAGRDRLLIDGDGLSHPAFGRALHRAKSTRCCSASRSASPPTCCSARWSRARCCRPSRTSPAREKCATSSARPRRCIRCWTCRDRSRCRAGRGPWWSAGRSGCSAGSDLDRRTRCSTTTAARARLARTRDFPGDARQAIDALRRQISQQRQRDRRGGEAHRSGARTRGDGADAAARPDCRRYRERDPVAAPRNDATISPTRSSRGSSRDCGRTASRRNAC